MILEFSGPSAGQRTRGSSPGLVLICLGGRGPIQLVHADAGWSSSVARWAHNPEVAGSNPAPATKFAVRQMHIFWRAAAFPDSRLAVLPSVRPTSCLRGPWLKQVRRADSALF